VEDAENGGAINLCVLNDLCVQLSLRSQLPRDLRPNVRRTNAGIAEDAENGGSVNLCVLSDLCVQPFSAISVAPAISGRIVRKTNAGIAERTE
jgi:hypothetical protein